MQMIRDNATHLRQESGADLRQRREVAEACLLELLDRRSGSWIPLAELDATGAVFERPIWPLIRGGEKVAAVTGTKRDRVVWVSAGSPLICVESDPESQSVSEVGRRAVINGYVLETVHGNFDPGGQFWLRLIGVTQTWLRKRLQERIR